MFIILAIALTVYGCRKAHQGIELPAVLSAAGVAVCLGGMVAHFRAYSLTDLLMVGALLATFAIAWCTRKQPQKRPAHTV